MITLRILPPTAPVNPSITAAARKLQVAFGYLVLANELPLALAPIAGLLGVLIGRWATNRWRSRRLPPSPRSHSRLASTNS